MSVSRLEYIKKIGVEQMGDLADSLKDPNVLRLEILIRTCARHSLPLTSPRKP